MVTRSYAMSLTLVFFAFFTGLAAASSQNVKKILHFSDVHLNISQSFDDSESEQIPIVYGKDAPIVLLRSALKYAKQVLPEPDFFLYTGDHAVHGDLTDEYIARAVATNVGAMENAFSLQDAAIKLQATAIIGNADASPDYHMEVTDPKTETNPTIENVSKVWANSLSKTNLDLFNRRGYLQYSLDEKLDVLTLNTVPYSPTHLPDTSDLDDPFGQFEWLNTTLSKLRKQSKFAYIVGHVPPFVDSYGGNPQWCVKYIQTYKQIVGNYADVIKAQLFGHVHSIEFRIPIADEATVDGVELVPLFASGSISPLFTNNPSFIIWDFDSNTHDLLDFTVYATNISASGQTLDWKPLFQATKAYNVPTLCTSSLRGFYKKAQKNSALVDNYYWNMKAQSPRVPVPKCTDALCRAKTLCTMNWWTTSAEFNACVDKAMSGTSTSIVTGQSTADTAGLSLPSTLMVIFLMLLTVAITIACVVVILHLLKKSGVFKTAEQREKEYDNVFPML